MTEQNVSTADKSAAPVSKPSKSRRRSRPPPRQRASFASLPPELKELVAEHVRTLDLEESEVYRPLPMSAYQVRDEVAEMMMKEGKRSTKELARMMVDLMAKVTPTRSGLSTFSLINRECFHIARPILWQHLDLGDRTVSSLLVFLRDILPRHASLVKSLVFDYESCLERSGLTGDDDAYYPPEHKRFVKAAERLANLRPHRKLSVRRLRAPGVFVGEIIKHLDSLEKVDFTPFAPEDYGLNEHWNTRWLDHAFQALANLKPRLKHLEIMVDWDVRDQAANLERLLRSSNDLESLELKGAVMEGEESLPPYQAMFSALARLSKLKRLSLDLPIPISFRKLDITWPLTSLCLDNTGPDSPIDLIDFLSLFSSTLTDLEMRYVYAVIDEGGATTSFSKLTASLPHLTRLAVANSAGEPDAFLSPFDKCPLEVLRIEDCSASAAEHVLAALETHKETLKKVQLLAAEYFMVLDEDNRKKVREWCESTGVVYEDVEHEDSDEYGSEGSYEDSPEFGYYDESEEEEEQEEGGDGWTDEPEEDGLTE
ncbi:hypothetical protein JCM11251_005971 [Rhodosporidiobolus azoricus]